MLLMMSESPENEKDSIKTVPRTGSFSQDCAVMLKSIWLKRISSKSLALKKTDTEEMMTEKYIFFDLKVVN